MQQMRRASISPLFSTLPMHTNRPVLDAALCLGVATNLDCLLIWMASTGRGTTSSRLNITAPHILDLPPARLTAMLPRIQTSHCRCSCRLCSSVVIARDYHLFYLTCAARSTAFRFTSPLLQGRAPASCWCPACPQPLHLYFPAPSLRALLALPTLLASLRTDTLLLVLMGVVLPLSPPEPVDPGEMGVLGSTPPPRLLPCRGGRCSSTLRALQRGRRGQVGGGPRRACSGATALLPAAPAVPCSSSTASRRTPPAAAAQPTWTQTPASTWSR
jgi:hypothetical protein